MAPLCPILGVRINENVLLEVPFKPFSDSLSRQFVNKSEALSFSPSKQLRSGKPLTSSLKTVK
jgi:hypothetical protein